MPNWMLILLLAVTLVMGQDDLGGEGDLGGGGDGGLQVLGTRWGGDRGLQVGEDRDAIA